VKQSTKAVLGSLVGLAIIVISFAAYTVVGLNERVSKFAPGDAASTYWDLKEQGIPMIAAWRAPGQPGHYGVLAHDTYSRWYFSSGPPAYLFDRSGNLVDYTLDSGDSQKFQDDYGVYSGDELSISELEEIFPVAPEV